VAVARRCVACATGAVVQEDLCAACLTCVRVCPFGAAQVDRVASTPPQKCLTCGLCAAECPAVAISLSRFGADQVKQELARLAQVKQPGDQPILVSFNCIYEAATRESLSPGEELLAKDGVLKILVPCVARLKLTELLMPFEHGADAVAVIACAAGECVYPTAEDRLDARVRRAKQVLEEIGLGGNRINLYQTQGTAEESWSKLYEEARNQLKNATKSSAEVSR
jgi:coenzyme F420-reducing hydrogenase delta subunit/Pyruvate/2-oxoacid:ferredoxin oxidoreductase delta subunit